MDSHLMEKEVLCILDTRQIQRFMFRSNAYVDTLGGSDLITHILEDGMRFTLQSVEPPLRKEEYDLSLDPDAPIPYFEKEKVLFQLMICAAGNRSSTTMAMTSIACATRSWRFRSWTFSSET